MKRLYFLPAACSLMSGCAATDVATHPRDLEAAIDQGEGAKILAAERTWLDATYHLDAATLDATESKDFLLITPAMMMNKQGHVESTRKRMSDVGSSSSPAEVTLTQQAIKVYGTIAIVSDVCTISGGGAKPVTSPGTYWQTEVWHREGGRWKIVQLHISMVAHGM